MRDGQMDILISLIGLLTTAVITLTSLLCAQSKKRKDTKSYYAKVKQTNENAQKQQNEYIQNNLSSIYKIKQSILNTPEQRIFYFCGKILEELSLENYYAFPQVQLYSIVEMRNRQRDLFPDPTLYDEILRKIIAKSIDVLICKKNVNYSENKLQKYFYTPVLAIEFDGSGHSFTPKQCENDNFKNNLFESIDLPFLRIIDKSNFIGKEIIAILNDKIKAVAKEDIKQ